MKNHELLDLIGEVNEEYVRAAGDNVIRPRFRWKTLAACAACAALIAAAYPVYRASHPALHDYTVLEGGTLATLEELKTPAEGQGDVNVLPPDPNPDQPVRGEGPDDIHGETYLGDVPVQEHASGQYDKLLRGMGMLGEDASSYPGWFAGAWIDHGGSPTTPAWLTVAIVDGMRTPEREAEITGWCGDGVVFESAKYSHNFLDSLMEPVSALLDGTGLACGIGVDVTENCLGVDLYSDGEAIPDSVLAGLAQLDPAGDAIRVQVFTQTMSTLTDEVKTAPAPVFDGAWAEPIEPTEFSVPDEERAEPNLETESTPVPGGKSFVEELPETKEAEQPARYDLFPHGE